MTNRPLAAAIQRQGLGRDLAALAVAIGLLLTACGGDSEAPADAAAQPFYLEADVVVGSRAATIGTNRPPASETTTTAIRWWNRDARHARWELGGLTGVLDGKRIWIHARDANTFSSEPLPPLPDGFVAWSLPMSLLIGPTNTADLDAFMADLRTRADTVAVAGSETLLGRMATIVEARPASRSSSQGGSGPEVESSHGSVRYWVDEERMFVMRVEVRDEVQDADAVVTRLDYPAEISDDVIEFVPPPGAIEVRP